MNAVLRSISLAAVACLAVGALADETVVQPWSWTKDDDAVLSGGAAEFQPERDVAARSLSVFGGPYLFKGNAIMKIGEGGLSVNEAEMTVSNRLEFAAGTTLAFTNSTFRYRGTYVDGSAFSTGDKKAGSRLEIVNTTDRAEGMFWDCMGQGIQVGVNASDCSFLFDGGEITGGTVITNVASNKKGLALGIGTGAANNFGVMRGGAEFWDEVTVNNAGNDFGRGAGSNNNRFEILGGDGFVTKLYKGYPGSIGKESCTGNVVVVDGVGFAGSAVWKCRSETLNVGASNAVSNELWIVNGGLVEGPAVNVGLNASSNTLYVVGQDSILRGGDGSTALTVGSGGNPARSVGNRLVIADGGKVERFGKWSTVIGGHENEGMRGEAIDNGVEVRSGGSFVIPNDFRIGRAKKSGSRAEGNYLLVSGEGSVARTSTDKSTDIGTAVVDGTGDTGATTARNMLRVEDGGYFFSRNIYLVKSSTSTSPDAATNNSIVVTRNGRIDATYEVSTGLAADATRAPEEVVAKDNKIIAEEGGVLEARTLKTYSGNGNTIVARNGGVLQFFEKNPHIEPFEPGAIALENGVFSYRVENFNIQNLETCTTAGSLPDLTVRGHNAFRMNSCANDIWNASQTYTFSTTDNPRHFCRLEMVDGTTTYRGKTGDTLTIATTGSMLCSNTTARVEMPFTLDGPITVVNSSLALTKSSSLNAPVTLVDATLDLPEGMTVGSNFALTIGGELESGRDIITSATDLTLSATLPDCWRLKKRATETGFAYYTEYRKPGMAIIVK